MTGIPRRDVVPILRQLFSNDDSTIRQTDIVMLITPRIIRTHEYTVQDLSPIYVGTNQNFGLTGPPPLIAAHREPTPARGAAGACPAPDVPPQGFPCRQCPQTGTPGVGDDSQCSGAGSAAPAAAVARSDRATSERRRALAPAAQISVTAPAGDVRVGSGPYLVPVYVSGVSRASTVTLTITYNPAILRMRDSAGGQFSAAGRHQRGVHAEHGCRRGPDRSDVRANRRHGGRIGFRAAGRHSVRRECSSAAHRSQSAAWRRVQVGRRFRFSSFLDQSSCASVMKTAARLYLRRNCRRCRDHGRARIRGVAAGQRHDEAEPARSNFAAISARSGRPSTSSRMRPTRSSSRRTTSTTMPTGIHPLCKSWSRA